MKATRSFFLFLLSLGVFIPLSFGAGIGVKPLRTELFIAPGETETAIINVINGDSNPTKARPTIEVYTKNDESGFPIAQDLSEDDPRNIESWISFSEEITDLPPNEEVPVTIEVTVPQNAEPGGRYAAILYEPITEENSEGVQIRSRVASLLLITVSGQQIQSGNVLEFAPTKEIFNDKGYSFDVRFENTGNVHLSPQGTITLEDLKGNPLTEIARYMDRESGKEILSGEIPTNPNAGNVLPGSIRVFEGKWNENVKTGTFKANLSLTYPGRTEPIKKSTELSVIENLDITNFDLTSTNDTTSFQIEVRNKGNIHEKLIGKIEVTNEFDYLVADIPLPEDMEYTAPGQTKNYSTPWISKELPKGKYTATLKAHHGLTKKTIEEVHRFGDLGIHWGVILGILAMIIIAALTVLVVKKK